MRSIADSIAALPIAQARLASGSRSRGLAGSADSDAVETPGRDLVEASPPPRRMVGICWRAAGGGRMAVVQSLYHEMSARCVWCDQPPGGRGVKLERGADGKPRYLCQRCIDADVDPETAQRCRDYHLLMHPFPFLCRDESGCTSSHDPDGPCQLFECHTTDSDGARVRSFAVHFGDERPPWDETTMAVKHLEDLGCFDDLAAAIGWLRVHRPTWRGLRANGGWF